MIRSSNPALNKEVFTPRQAVATSEYMTLGGTVNKTVIMLLLLLCAAGYVWNGLQNVPGQDVIDPSSVYPLTIIGAIAGLILALITIFKKSWSPVTAPLYAVCEGFFLGGISSIFEARYPGIVIQAVGLTFGTLFALLMAYKSGLIRATENFKLGVTAATGGIFLIYLVGFILSFFGTGIPYIHESGIIGIGFSLFVVVIAALNLVIDFDFIEHGAAGKNPKYMEWFAAFGLMVTLIWLYIEFLHLLAKLREH